MKRYLRAAVLTALIVAAVFGTRQLVRTFPPHRGAPGPSLLDEVSEANADFAASLDRDYAASGDASAAYARLKDGHRERVRAIYARHGRTPPGE